MEKKNSLLSRLDARAFTLIELLVVVLIIGILAAVAVPQYRLAVGKARLSNLISMANAVVQAEEIFYMANGTYTNQWEELAVSFPGSISYGYLLTSNDGYRMELWLNGTTVPDSIYVTDTRLPGNALRFAFRSTTYNLWKNGRRACYAVTDNTQANKLCQQVTHKKQYSFTSGGSTDNYGYWID